MSILKATKNNITFASKIVKKGGTIIYPTETVYGLGCDPFNKEAVNNLLEVKGKRTKPFPILAANIEDANKAAYISLDGKKLAAKFWPGPLTIIFPKKPSIPDIVTFDQDSVGLRVPDNKIALQLIHLCGGLLIGSSANKTGEKPPRSVQEISEEMKDMVNIVLDGGITAKGIPSTVVDLTLKKPRILREGPINLKELSDVLTFST
jgi:L-threonylcarbamoyladenylate synthase